MLVGRERERGQVLGVLASARVGQGAALVLVGEAGIGKSALLADADAVGHGMRTLRVAGVESESEVPFGSLLQLLRPALGHLPSIPAPQAAALGTALALTPGRVADRFAVGAATLSLLSRFAEDQPLLLLVDDAHLLDLPSAQALVFAARRMTIDPVALLAAAREGHPCAVTDAGLPQLAVGGLALPEATRLVAGTGRTLGDAAAARLHQLTGGNPLALEELAAQADDLAMLPAGVPTPVPASLVQVFAHRADQLSSAARLALLVAATGGDDLGLVTRACAVLGAPVDGLEEAEEAGLVHLTGSGVSFRHGLVRSAVYAGSAPAQRRAVNGALAAALPATEVDRRAWHLGEAALGPEEHVASLLATAAGRAQDRGAHAVAAGIFRRAAELSPDPPTRAGRLVAAAECSWQAGQDARAGDLLDQLPAIDRPQLAARVSALRGTLAARGGDAQRARDLLVDAAGRPGTDPDAAIGLLADATLACFFLGDTGTLRRVGELLAPLSAGARTPWARCTGALAIGVAEVFTGRPGTDRIRAALAAVTPTDPLVGDPRVAPWLVLGPLFLRESTAARPLVEAVVAAHRDSAGIGTLPLLLFYVGRDQATTDRWDAAEVSYTEGIELARETGHTADLAAGLAGLAWVQARQGREAPSRAHAEEALEICRARRLGTFQAWALYALGELELGAGRTSAALARFDQLTALLADLHIDDVDLSPAPEVVEILLGSGDPDRARSIAARYARDAAEKGQPWALARAARLQAITGSDADSHRHVDRAMQWHGCTLDSFERARTQLAHGVQLRRARHRATARVPLRAALATFEELGATPWADRAAAEVQATGETAHRREVSALRELTPQERHIAGMLTAGRTTRETAAALFLSPKTIEYHLRHIYQKLGVTSRAELAARLAIEG